MLRQDVQSVEAAVPGMVGVVTTIGVVQTLEDEVDGRFCLQLLAEQQRRDVPKELTHLIVVIFFLLQRHRNVSVVCDASKR